MRRTVRKTLICPVCGDVVGEAVHRRWPGSLKVRTPVGENVAPLAAGVVRRLVDRELAEAADAVAVAEAQARADYVLRNITDPIYDLHCRRGHSTLRTTPEIVRAMSAAVGTWASLTPPRRPR